MRTSLSRDIKTGIVFGIILATIYSAFATIVFALGGASVLEEYNTSLATVILAYYSGGLLGGLIVGLLMPMTRHWVGSLLVRLVVAAVVLLGARMAMSGPPWVWDRAKWDSVLFLTIVFAIGSFLAWPLKRV